MAPYHFVDDTGPMWRRLQMPRRATLRPEPLRVLLILWSLMAAGFLVGSVLGRVLGGSTLSMPLGLFGAVASVLVASWFFVRQGYSRWLGFASVTSIVLAAGLPLAMPWPVLLATLGPVAGLCPTEPRWLRRTLLGLVTAAGLFVIIVGLLSTASALDAEIEAWLDRISGTGQTVVAPPHDMIVTKLWATDATDGPVTGYQVAASGLTRQILVRLYPPDAAPCAALPDHTVRTEGGLQVAEHRGRVDAVCRKTPQWVAQVSGSTTPNVPDTSAGLLADWLAVPDHELLTLAESLAPVDPRWVTERYRA